ncbi:MAG: porin [Aquificae bacterium]|nr:porin [Aquificota bacterium]
MKKAVGAVVLASAVFSTAALATNGDNLICSGPICRAMGGAGIGLPMETDSIYKNPAWLAEYSDGETLIASFGGTLFLPTVKAKIDTMMMNVDANENGTYEPGEPMINAGGMTNYAKSKADTFAVPEIGVLYRSGRNLTFGIAAFGISGMGVDYRNLDDPIANQALSQMNTLFQFFRFMPSVGYKAGNFYIGGSVHLAYGLLSIGAITCATNPDGSIRPSTCSQSGSGASTDLGAGYDIGIGYKLFDMVYIGANYQSPIEMKYNRVFDFNKDGVYDDLKLEQPAEYGIGIGADFGNVRLVADYKKIKWSEAYGYGKGTVNFGWKDQDVYALGAEFTFGRLKLRFGYNNGESPIPDAVYQSPPMTPTQFMGAVQTSYFNLVGFPAITEEAYTTGFSYNFSKHFTVDFAYTYIPEATVTQEAQMDPGGGYMTVYKATAKNQQDVITAALTYKY